MVDVFQHPAEDQAALDQRRRHVGERLEVDLLARRVALRDQIEARAEAAPPCQRALGVEVADLAVEKLVLIAE